MPRDFKLYLQDILKAIERIDASVKGLDQTQFEQNAEKMDSVLFNLMTIGEAAKQIPQEIRDLQADVSWSAIGRFRDFVVHHYFSLDIDKVWDIVATDIPELKPQIQQLLRELSNDDNASDSE